MSVTRPSRSSKPTRSPIRIGWVIAISTPAIRLEIVFWAAKPMISPTTAVEAKIPAASRSSAVNWARTIATTTRKAARASSRRRIVSRVLVERETCETAGDMEANLVGGGVAKPQRTFPYANWGPWAAILGVLAALAVGLVLGVPALFVGAQHGKIEALFPPSFSSGASFDKGNATALALDAAGNRLFADHEDEVRTFGPLGQELKADAITGLDDSHGLAFDPGRNILAVSEKGPGTVSLYATGSGAPRQMQTIHLRSLGGGGAFQPERLAFAAGAAGGLYVINAGEDQVLRLSAKGGFENKVKALKAPGGESVNFDFGSDDNDLAVDNAAGPGRGDVFVMSGKGEGTVWAYSPAGRFLWELTPESGDEFAALAVDGNGNLWIAEPNGDTYEYGRSPGAHRAPAQTGGKIDAGNEVSAVEFAPAGHVFVARELDNTLSALGSILSQAATELGFLLVPMALVSMRGANGLKEILQRLGFRAFKPSAFGWMAVAFAIYLAFTIFYSLVITEPKQKDIAESFGPTIVQILLIVIAAPIAEETCFRGMLFGGLREKLPRLAAALITGVIFGSLHALTGVSAVPPLIVFGIVLALLYEKTGSIIPGILLHMINNAIALIGQ
jgi:membrane protease YdiL (CAAX protease family)